MQNTDKTGVLPEDSSFYPTIISKQKIITNMELIL